MLTTLDPCPKYLTDPSSHTVKAEAKEDLCNIIWDMGRG